MKEIPIQKETDYTAHLIISCVIFIVIALLFFDMAFTDVNRIKDVGWKNVIFFISGVLFFLLFILCSISV